MVRHSDDNDKKPRPRQGRQDKPFGDKGKGSPIKGKRYSADPRAQKPEKTEAAPRRTERIAKAMARAGIASRREVERLIGLGKVAVNGTILSTPATLVTRDDVITVDGKPIGSAQAARVWRYHKPAGLVTSHADPQGRPTVFDALPSGLPRVISVGRLDLNTEGLLLLTNDGELSRALELPETGWVRQYRARARGRVTQEQLDRLKAGTTVEGVRYGPMEATLDKVKEKAGDEKGPANVWISVSVAEGKYREVRKVLESLGLKVNRLIRLAYGPFQLGTLDVGHVEEVGPRVIRELLAEFIRPENLPTGNSVETPAPIPGRRPQGPVVRGRSGSAMSDPSRKPSKVRAAEAAATDAVAARDKPVKKEGWAKARPKFEHPKRAFKPRARAEGAEGEAASAPRPKRPFKPREDQFIDKPKAPRSKTPQRGGSASAGRPAGRAASTGPARSPERRGPPRKPR